MSYLQLIEFQQVTITASSKGRKQSALFWPSFRACSGGGMRLSRNTLPLDSITELSLTKVWAANLQNKQTWNDMDMGRHMLYVHVTCSIFNLSILYCNIHFSYNRIQYKLDVCNLFCSNWFSPKFILIWMHPKIRLSKEVKIWKFCFLWVLNLQITDSICIPYVLWTIHMQIKSTIFRVTKKIRFPSLNFESSNSLKIERKIHSREYEDSICTSKTRFAYEIFKVQSKWKANVWYANWILYSK